MRECARDPRYNVSDKNVMDAAHFFSLPLPLPLPQTYAPWPVWSDSTTAPIRFASDAQEGRGAPLAPWGVTSTAARTSMAGMVALSAPRPCRGIVTNVMLGKGDPVEIAEHYRRLMDGTLVGDDDS